jgi:Fe-S-cluster-containing hydrogenase component 2
MTTIRERLRTHRAEMHLHIVPDLCTGCCACEVACVAHHEGVFGRSAARLTVLKQDSAGVDYPNVCRFCVHPACIDACPTEALRRDTVGLQDPGEPDGPVICAIILSEAKCTGCGACTEACPFYAANIHPWKGVALICDLCGCDPVCVKRCATGAITFVETGPRFRP